MTSRTGPFEEDTWPARLKAVASTSSPRPRLHGYDLDRDLAQHYGLAEVMLLALTGDAPTPAVGRAFERAILFACPCPVNEAPTHGAVLARSFGAPLASALATGTLIASEASRTAVEDQRDLLQWLCNSRVGPLPSCAAPTKDGDVEAVDELRRALLGAAAHLAPPAAASRLAAAICVMWECGLKTEDQLIAALVWARTLSIAAETIAASRGGLTSFPALLPPFRYEAPPR